MHSDNRPILVFGATEQQGGSVVAALLAGWPVRAFVRDSASRKCDALRAAGAELCQGTFEDVSTMRRAMKGVHGVFSVHFRGRGHFLGPCGEEPRMTIGKWSAQKNIGGKQRVPGLKLSNERKISYSLA